MKLTKIQQSRSIRRESASPAGKISEAKSRLRVALLQIEDEIVKQHVSEALKLLEE